MVQLTWIHLLIVLGILKIGLDYKNWLFQSKKWQWLAVGMGVSSLLGIGRLFLGMTMLHVGYSLLIIGGIFIFFYLHNKSLLHFFLLGWGSICNGLVITLNGGLMPIDSASGPGYISMKEKTIFPALGDWINLRLLDPSGLYSPGDIIIILALFMILVRPKST